MVSRYQFGHPVFICVYCVRSAVRGPEYYYATLEPERNRGQHGDFQCDGQWDCAPLLSMAEIKRRLG